MSSLFTNTFFANNRSRLKKTVQSDTPIVIGANGLLQKSSDATYPFIQDGNFWYVTGINQPDLIMVIDGELEYLILPTLSASQEYFDGKLDTDKLIAISGIQHVYDEATGWEKLTARLKQTKTVATLEPAPAYIATQGFYTNPARSSLHAKLKKIDKKLSITDIRQQFGLLRMIKQAEEIEAIEMAIATTVRALNKIKSKLANYSQEYEVEADLSREFRYQGSQGHAFEPIVASGSNACIIHYTANKSPIRKNDLLLLDVGARHEQYCADISRTFSVNKPSKRQKQVHQAVCDVQDYAYSIVKPGLFMKELEQKVEEYMGDKLRELGLIKHATHDEIRKYYPHAVSHFLGYDVHDIGDYDVPLQSGAVITIEPGIYIPEEGIGVRIEDDVEVTKSGIRILSNELSRAL